MPTLVEKIQAGFVRVGQEIKTVRQEIAARSNIYQDEDGVPYFEYGGATTGPSSNRRTQIAVAFIGQSVTAGAVLQTQINGQIAGTTLTVNNLSQGLIEVGHVLYGTGVVAGTTVTAQLSGPTYKAGTYAVSVSQNVSATAMTVENPNVFRSLRKQSEAAPYNGAATRSGGAHGRFIDVLWDYGYDVTVVNGAKGSMSLSYHGTGFLNVWNANSQNYRQKRAAVPGSQDRGYYGDVICPNGATVFRCVRGKGLAVMGDGVEKLNVAGPMSVAKLGYIIDGNETFTTGATKPAAFDTAVVGDIVTDGTVQWEAIATNMGPFGGQYRPVNAENATNLGFDPLGVLQDAANRLKAVSAATDKFVYIDGNQSDLSGYPWRQETVEQAGRFFLNRGFKVVIGNMIFSPGTYPNADFYEFQNTANRNAYNTLLAAYPGRVFFGADLYTTFGGTNNTVANGYITPDDSVHLNSAGTLKQGDDYGASFKTNVLTQPGWT